MANSLQLPADKAARMVSPSGFDLINTPRLNKGTAFTSQERDIFALHGLLPSDVGTLEEQLERRMQALDNEATPFTKYALLRDVRAS